MIRGKEDSMAVGQETSFGLLYHLETSELFLQLHLGIIKNLTLLNDVSLSIHAF